MDDIDMNKIQMLPGAYEDIGTQRCRLGIRVLESLGAQLGSAAWIKPPDGPKILGTLWSRNDDYNGFIQLNNNLVLEHLDQDKPGDIDDPKKCIGIKDIEILPRVPKLSYVDVTVVLNDFQKVSKCRKSKTDLCFKAKHVLRNLVVADRCIVNCYELPTGKEFGISYIIINHIKPYKYQTNDSDLKIGKCISNTEINITKLTNKERFEQRLGLSCHRTLPLLGGLDREMKLLIDLVMLPILHKSNAQKLGIQSHTGVLLQGPPGCGKSTLVRHLAKQCDAYLLIINGPEVYGSRPGETEEALRSSFDKARIMSEEGPCILFLDEIDALCPARGSGSGSTEHRVVSQLLALLDQMSTMDGVIVVAATNNPAGLEPALRRPGRLEKQILIGIPTMEKRAAILKTLLSDECVHPSVQLEYLAECTPGYVGADLASLVQSAQYEASSQLQKGSEGGSKESFTRTAISVTLDHFKTALHSITPSTQRGSDILVDYKPLTWDDIGGLEEVKVKLKQAVEWPLKHPEAFARLGIPRPKGVLLYGPPGCAKTTLVRAAATSCHVTFLAVSGGQLYSPYVGDSERKLTQIFNQARAGAPSILFIDELDSVIGSRSKGSGVKGVQERVLSTLLNEMDGIGLKVDDITRSHDKVAEGETVCDGDKKSHASDPVDNTDVLVVAATNRPDMLDDAILRPGRIDRIIYVPPPDKQARLSILRVHSKKLPLDGVNLAELADKTEGFTGADLENLCREAALHALSVDGLSTDCVTGRHFEHVLASLIPSLSAMDLRRYSQIQTQLNLKSS